MFEWRNYFIDICPPIPAYVSLTNWCPLSKTKTICHVVSDILYNIPCVNFPALQYSLNLRKFTYCLFYSEKTGERLPLTIQVQTSRWINRHGPYIWIKLINIWWFPWLQIAAWTWKRAESSFPYYRCISLEATMENSWKSSVNSIKNISMNTHKEKNNGLIVINHNYLIWQLAKLVMYHAKYRYAHQRIQFLKKLELRCQFNSVLY